MSRDTPHPELDEVVASIGEVGQRLCHIDASEGAGGNISAFLGWQIELSRRFPIEEPIELPRAVPELVGGTLLVTGSGRRLREIRDDPEGNLGCVVVDGGGRTGRLCTSPRRRFEGLTCEFGSHLAVHRDQISGSHNDFHALVHAHPPHLTYLSHIPAYRDPAYLNRHVLRWQPEAIVHLPEGMGVVSFLVPGSPELVAATVDALRSHRMVVWAKHGAVARSGVSVKRAADLLDYGEIAARYECFNLAQGGQGEGLTPEEVRAISDFWQIRQTVF
jgi:rhamnulose-1-phosphate aldolase